MIWVFIEGFVTDDAESFPIGNVLTSSLCDKEEALLCGGVVYLTLAAAFICFMLDYFL